MIIEQGTTNVDDTAPNTDANATSYDANTTSAPSAFSMDLPENWGNSLDESLRGVEGIKGITNLNDLVAKVATAEKFGMDGKNTISLPEVDGDFGKVYDRLGRPESADKYDVAKPEGMEDSGLQWSDEKANGWKEKMYELGLSNKQAKSLFDTYNTSVMEQVKTFKDSQTAKYAEVELAMKKEFGDQYSNVLNSASKVASDFKVKEVLEQAGVYNNPLVQNLLIAVAEANEEDTGFGTSSTQNISNVQEEIDKLMGSDPYWDQSSEQHQGVKNKVHKLFEQLEKY